MLIMGNHYFCDTSFVLCFTLAYLTLAPTEETDDAQMSLCPSHIGRESSRDSNPGPMGKKVPFLYITLSLLAL